MSQRQRLSVMQLLLFIKVVLFLKNSVVCLSIFKIFVVEDGCMFCLVSFCLFKKQADILVCVGNEFLHDYEKITIRYAL